MAKMLLGIGEMEKAVGRALCAVEDCVRKIVCEHAPVAFADGKM
jgi:hypothetical protein